MKSIFKYIILFSSVFVATSCEDVVQIKLDEGSKLLVIDAFINDMPGKQTVKLTSNDSYFSNREAPPFTGAQVKLKDLSNGKEYNFVYSGNGNYDLIVDSLNPIGFAGHQYELSVTAEGVTYTGLTIQKRGAALDSIVPTLAEDIGGFGPAPLVPYFICTMYARDKTDANTDYYWIKTIRNDTLLFGPSDINLSIDGTNGAVPSAAVDTLDFTPPIVFLGFNRFYPGNTCEAQIHSLSREAYNFFVQASAQINNGGLFATTPENVKTNIVTPVDAKTKAVGFFNMATVARRKIVVP